MIHLSPSDFVLIATLILATIVMAHRDDPRAWNWLKAQWSKTVGAWCAKRRLRIRVPAPYEHSAGIMVARRDVNIGNWT